MVSIFGKYGGGRRGPRGLMGPKGQDGKDGLLSLITWFQPFPGNHMAFSNNFRKN